MDELEEEDKRVVISVFENFAWDKVGGAKEKTEIESKATMAIEKICGSLDDEKNSNAERAGRSMI